jgi:hypothetical protein
MRKYAESSSVSSPLKELKLLSARFCESTSLEVEFLETENGRRSHELKHPCKVCRAKWRVCVWLSGVPSVSAVQGKVVARDGKQFCISINLRNQLTTFLESPQNEDPATVLIPLGSTVSALHYIQLLY